MENATGIKTGICVFDLHFPNHNKKLWENILKVVGDLKPDYFLFGGDNMDMECISHWLHDKGNRKQLEGKRLKKDYVEFQRDILDNLEKVMPDYCRKIWLKGNHCGDWVDLLVARSPELEGFAEVENNLNLKEWEIYKYRQTAKVGKIYFHHGEYTGKHHASKMVDTFGRNIVFGHLHTYQVHTRITPIDCEAHSAYSMPCACDINPEYMRDKPSAWLNGFGVFYTQENGNFNIYPVISNKGHFVFNGVYY